MKVNFDKIYEHIGYLFYALAAERGKLTSADRAKLARIIDHNWGILKEGKSPLQAHLKNDLMIGIDHAFDLSMNTKEAYALFENYYLLNKLPFNHTLKDKIFQTTHAVASAFLGNNSCHLQVVKDVEALLEIKHEISHSSAT